MNKAVFLDRDGTINIDKDYLYKVDDFEYLPGVIEGLKCLQQLGYILIVVTNQSGIARGYYKEEDYFAIDKWMKADLLEKGVKITASYFCPHLPNGIIPKYSVECECRKPKLYLYEKATREYDIDLTKTLAIGDKPRDLAICNAYGCKGYLLGDNIIEVPENTECFPDWFKLTESLKKI